MNVALATRNTASLEKFIKSFPTNLEFFSVDRNLHISMSGIADVRACFYDSGLPDGCFKRDAALRAMVVPPVADYRYSHSVADIPALENGITFPADPFIELLDFAADRDVRYYLNGVLITPEHGGKLVATNGHILRMVSFPDAAKLAAPVILPRDFLELAKKFKADSLKIQGESDKPGAASFMAGYVYSQCKGIDGRFPDYMRVIPAMDKLTNTVNLPSAKQAATWGKVAKLLGSKWPSIGIESGNFVSIHDDRRVIHGPADMTDFPIHFQQHFFVIACKVANGQPLRFDNGKAAIFDDKSVSVFMPCRV